MVDALAGVTGETGRNAGIVRAAADDASTRTQTLTRDFEALLIRLRA